MSESRPSTARSSAHTLARWSPPALAVIVMFACEKGALSPPSSGRWIREVLGQRADGVVVLRLGLARNDPVYGALVRGGLRDHEIDPTLSSIASVEAWVVADGSTIANSSWLFAVYPVPSAGAEPWWKVWGGYLGEARRLPSNTLEYTSSRGDIPFAIYGYPDGTLIAGTGSLVERLIERARRTDAPPSPTTYEHDAIFAVNFGPRVYHLREVNSTAMSLGIQSAWAIVRASGHGDMAFAAQYDTVDHAKAAEVLVDAGAQRLREGTAEAVRQCPPLARLELGFRRDGRTISGHLGKIPEVLAAARDQRCK